MAKDKLTDLADTNYLKNVQFIESGNIASLKMHLDAVDGDRIVFIKNIELLHSDTLGRVKGRKSLILSGDTNALPETMLHDFKFDSEIAFGGSKRLPADKTLDKYEGCFMSNNIVGAVKLVL